MAKNTVNICSIGWGLELINTYIQPVCLRLGLDAIHFIVDDVAVNEDAKIKCKDLVLIDILEHKDNTLPEPDIQMLSELESHGHRTIRSIIMGDRVLRKRNPTEVLSYITLLAKNLIIQLNIMRPNLIISGFDSAHSGISYLVGRKLGIPWIAIHHSTIPEGLIGFCNGLTPNSLIPIIRDKNNDLITEAQKIIKQVKSKNLKLIAYKSPVKIRDIYTSYSSKLKNQLRRSIRKSSKKDRFINLSTIERAGDVWRRGFNLLVLLFVDIKFCCPKSKYIYFPLHMSPESSIDTWGPFYMDQISLIKQMSLSVPIDVKIVVKLHFSDPDNYGYRELKGLIDIPRVCVIHPSFNSQILIENATIIATITGTAALEGALIGKPILLFGDSPYQFFPRSERAKNPDQLAEQIQRMLYQKVPTDDEILEAYVNYLRRFLLGRNNDWSIITDNSEINRVSNALKLLLEKQHLQS
jgi:hypothetical protein